MLNAFTSCAAVAAFTTLASAQSFNIDVGTATPAPTTPFGAGASQPGVWNTYAGGTLNNLLDLAGTPTGVTLAASNNSGFLGSNNDPATLGDDENLIDDLMLVPFLDSYTFSGLAGGTYDVYAYTWTFQQLPTDMQVNGGGYQTVGGAWPGGYVAGITHSLQSVTIPANGSISLDIHSVNGALGGLSGIQLVQVPTPAGVAVLLAGAGIFTRRRR